MQFIVALIHLVLAGRRRISAVQASHPVPKHVWLMSFLGGVFLALLCLLSAPAYATNLPAAIAYPLINPPLASTISASAAPLQTPEPLTGIVVDAGDPGFSSSSGWAVESGLGTMSCADYAGATRWAKSRTPPHTNDTDWVRWIPTITQTGWYEVLAHWSSVSYGNVATEHAMYKIHSASGDFTVEKAQRNNVCQWVSLGRFQFSVGQEGYVYLGNYTGGEKPQRRISADAMRFVRQVTEVPYLSPIGNSDYDEYYALNWSPVSFPIGYEVWEGGGGDWYAISSQIPELSYDIFGQVPGDFCYRVRAYCIFGGCGDSNEECVSVRPLQNTPALNPIPSPDYDGNYMVQWSPIAWTDQFYLQEKLNGGSYSDVYQGLNTSWSATNRSAGLWCYRAQAQNLRGWSAWSSDSCVQVNAKVFLPLVLRQLQNPQLNAIVPPGSSKQYNVSWSAVPSITAYILQEDINPSFSSATTVYHGTGLGTSFESRGVRTVYYRIKSQYSTESSDWSNTQSVAMRWEMEPNNYYTQSTQLVGSSQDVYGVPDDAKDFFSVNVPVGGLITITLGNPGSGAQLQLFYQSTANLIGSDTSSPYQVTYNGLAGWYYIYIYKPTPYNNVAYTLKVTYPGGLAQNMDVAARRRSLIPM